MTKLTRSLIAAACLTGAAVLAAPTAGASPGHTTCKDLGALVAGEAHDQTVGVENRSLPPGSVDDLIHTVQVGGEFLGEPVPAFCQPR